jgi:hypothetical protein
LMLCTTTTCMIQVVTVFTRAIRSVRMC